MEKTLLSKVNKLFICNLFCVFSFTANAQMITYYDAPNNALYLQEVKNNVVTNLDTLVLLNMFEEYSFNLEGNKLYISWSSSNFPNKVYYINSYLISEKKQIKLETQNWIDFKKYPQFEKNKMTLSLNNNGINFNFDLGAVKMIVLSYGELTSDRLNKVVLKLSKL